MLGGEVEEREQHVGVLLQGRHRLWILRDVLSREPGDSLARLLAGLGVHDLVQRRLHACLEALRELVEDVAELVEPVCGELPILPEDRVVVADLRIGLGALEFASG